MTDADTLTWVKTKDQEFNNLFRRMDVDRDFLFLKPYVMRDNAGHKIPYSHNVTLPWAAIFFHRIVALLSSANQQVEVDGEKMEDKQTVLIEKFIEDMDYESNARLQKRGLIEAALLHWQRICGRGAIGARCCLKSGPDNELIPDILPVDMRHVVYEYDDDGLVRVGCHHKMNADIIRRDYGIKDWNRPTDRILDLLEHWDRNRNEVFIEKDLVFQQDNPYGYVPYVLQVAPTGYWFEDDEQIQHRGESILAIARNIINEANRFGTISATLTELSFNNNMQYQSKEGTMAAPPGQVELDTPQVFPVEIGGGYKAMPIEDTNKAAQMWWGMLNELMQMATISNANYGVIQFPLSGVAISSMTEAKDKIIVPELQGYSLFKRSLSEMIIRQMSDFKISAELGQPGHRKKYSYLDLKGDYAINFRFFSTSKEQQIADASIANALGNNVSEDYKRREVFKLQDPDGENQKKNIELLERTNPIIARKNLVHALIDADKDIEARIVLNELLMMIRNGQTSIGLPDTPEGSSKDLIPLLEAGGTGSRPPNKGAQ